MKASKIYLGLCLCLFVLAGCSATSVNTPRPEQLVPAGLPLYGTDRAEEILLRAHAGDVTAIGLTVAGYYFGVGGFPQDEFLAVNWLDTSYRLGAVHAAAFLLTMTHSDIPVTEENVRRLAACEFGTKSHLAPLFKESGLFDVEAQCRRLATALDDKDKQWQTEYQDRQKFWRERQDHRQAEIFLMRELASRPITEKEKNRILSAFWFGEDTATGLRRYIFYAATTHDIERESPDWSNARLLEQAIRIRDSWPHMGDLFKEAVILHAAFDPSLPLAIIREAHAGDSKAMLFMARNYAGGEMGFPRNIIRATYWLSRSARADAPIGKALTAVAMYWEERYPADTWLKAEQARISGDEEAGEIARTIQKLLEAQFGSEIKESTPSDSRLGWWYN